MAATVLLVEDEAGYAETYAWWLQPEYEVQVASTVEEACEVLEPSIDVVLLDRRLPDGSGTDVIEGIKECGLTCRVAMLTAVEPDFDVIDFDIQDYVVKPVSKEDLRTLVERLVQLATYDEYVQEIYALATKKAALEAAKSSHELETSPVFTTLEQRLKETQQRADETFEQLANDRDMRDLYRDLQARRV